MAGKYKGIRAGVINSENLELVKLLREHNNANIISFGARFISEEFAKQAIKTFLLTKFDEADETTVTRHERRVEQIEDLEENIDTKVTKTELDELDRLASMRAEVSDN